MSRFLDQRKQAKMQWVQDPSQSNVETLNNVRCDASRHFRNKKKAYLKAIFLTLGAEFVVFQFAIQKLKD
jgi:hypothetical protein